MNRRTELSLLKPIEILFSILLLVIPVSPMDAAESSAPENMALINHGGFMRGIDKTPDRNQSNPSSRMMNYAVSKEAFDDESPAAMIYLDAFYMDIYEVSNAQFIDFIKATDYPAPAYWDHHQLNQPNQPVTGVNWYDANAYCHWANKRLPTEAEWEKAARGPAGSIYPWGNTLDDAKANFAKGKTGQKSITVPVDAYPEGKSYYGIYNMAGNVFEWVQDWYDPNFYRVSKESKNPQGPQFNTTSGNAGPFENSLKGKKKVIRGGSWFAPAQSITTTHRFWNDPMNNSYGVGLGFRCARNAQSDSHMMESRSFYMDALIQAGAEKYPEAQIAIQKAIKGDPDNQEYHHLLKTIKEKL